MITIIALSFPSEKQKTQFAEQIHEMSTFSQEAEGLNLRISFTGDPPDLSRILALASCFGGKISAVSSDSQFYEKYVLITAQKAGIASPSSRGPLTSNSGTLFAQGSERLQESRFGALMNHRVLMIGGLLLFLLGMDFMRLAFVRLDPNQTTLVETKFNGRTVSTSTIDHAAGNKARDEKQLQNIVLCILSCGLGIGAICLGISVRLEAV